MARLADEVINWIKEDVSLLRLVESQGHKVAKQGKDYMVSCPFHEEKTPSCIISPKTNLFNCFGFGTGGSVIDWVMKTQGVSFRFACEILQKDLGLVIESGTNTTKQNTTTKPTYITYMDTHFSRKKYRSYRATGGAATPALYVINT